MAPTTQPPYHHGNLCPELLAGAERALATARALAAQEKRREEQVLRSFRAGAADRPALLGAAAHLLDEPGVPHRLDPPGDARVQHGVVVPAGDRD